MPERSLNSVTLVGRIGKPPEVRGSEMSPVTMLSVATNTFREDANNPGSFIKNVTDWHRVVCLKPGLSQWAASNLNTGDRIMVTGKVTYRNISVPDIPNRQIKVCSIVSDMIVLCSSASNRVRDDDYRNEQRDFNDRQYSGDSNESSESNEDRTAEQEK